MESKNYFLGSVGRVEAFRETDSGLELAFVSKTLTDSGINTSITADDIRAGQGAPIVTRFYHDASVEITLTDVMFKPEYVEAQLGASFTEEGDEAYAFITEKDVECTSTAGEGHLILGLPHGHAPVALGSGCINVNEIPVWYTEVGKNDWEIGQWNAASQRVDGNKLSVGKKYCVRYLAESLFAREAKITADILPQELHLIITVPLYAGDACAASNGQLAGEVQFDVPRFRLNGSQDFAAAMSSNQTMSLAGSALAKLENCDNSGLLYTMRILKTAEAEAGVKKKYTMLESLSANENVGEVPMIYGIKPNGEADLIANGLLAFPEGALGADGKWASTGEKIVTLGSGSDQLSVTVDVQAA